MKISLKNSELAVAIKFMKEMPLKGTDSRHRTKFVKLLTSAYEDFSESEKELLKEFNLLDEAGNIIEADKQSVADVQAFLVPQKELYAEQVVIEGGQYANNITEIPRILKEYDGELDGAEADIYDTLLDEFEKGDNQ